MTRFKNVRKMSLVCLVYTFDTVFGLVYTLYFSWFWFHHEAGSSDQSSGSHRRGMAVPPGDYKDEVSSSSTQSQSASPAHELFLTVSATVVVTVVRAYFNLVVVSFTRQLLKQYGHDEVVADDEQTLFQNKGVVARVRRTVFEIEVRSRDILLDLFS
ncbi:hypothetical protein PSN45_003824 [Yamadazyma tenuis]|nr:hypothetical protein PSN45_003824 [Yamadazyma tenuis]